MSKSFFLSLALSLFVAPIAIQNVHAKSLNTQKLNIEQGSPIIIAGFLSDIKESVESVRDGIESTNETTTGTIDALHGANEAVGSSQEIIGGDSDSQGSTVIQTTEIKETTTTTVTGENSVEELDSGVGF